MINLNYLTDRILYQIILTIISQNLVNKIENSITFRIKTEYYLDLDIIMLETMKLLGNTKSKITKDGNDEIVPLL